MTPFLLDPQLERDTAPIAELALCAVRLMRDRTYPWLLLVPRRAELAEIIDLDRSDQAVLMEEVAAASRALKSVAPCDKLNVGAIGNIVRQLHVHVVARRVGDPAWPKPVWGHAPAEPYAPADEQALIAAVRAALSDNTAPA